MFLKYRIVLFVFLLFFSLACKKEHPGSKHKVPAITQSDTLFDAPDLQQAYLSDIRAAQNAIIANPKDKNARQVFLNIAYLPTRHMLVAVGAAVKYNNKRPIPRGLVQRAALLDAKRWAAYGKSWLLWKNEPDYGKIDVYFKGYYKTMPSFTRNDSLFIPIVLRIY